MKQLFALARFEAGLWLRSAGFWLAAVAMHLYTFGVFRFTHLHTSRRLSEQILGNGLLFGALFILFTSAAVMLRDRAERTEELLDAGPATNGQLLLSRWFGGVAVWLLLGLEIFALAGILIALQDGAVLELWPLISFYLSHYVPAVLFIHTLGMAAGVFVRHPFVLYPILTGAWAGAGLGVMELSFDRRWEFFTLFHLTGVGSPVQRVSALAGIYPFEGYIFWQRVFFVGLTLLLTAMAVLLFRSQRELGDARRAQRVRRSVVTTVFSALLIIFGGFGYMELHMPTIVALGNDDSLELLTADIRVDAYDLYVRIGEDGRYSVRSNLNVMNAGDAVLQEIGLLLSPLCKVADDANTNTQHNRVTNITLDKSLHPGDATELHISYECPLHPVKHRLPTPTTRMEMLDELQYPTARGGLTNMKRFTLTLDAPTRFKLATNIPRVSVDRNDSGRDVTRFEGEATRLDVFGGPLAYEVIAGLEAYYYSVHAAAIENLVNELADGISFYEKYLGPAEYIPGVTPLPVVVETMNITSSFQSSLSGHGFLGVSEWSLPQYYGGELGPTQRFELNGLALSLWWGSSPLQVLRSALSGEYFGPTGVEVAANQYLSVLHLSERTGDQWYKKAISLMLDDWAARRDNLQIRSAGETAHQLGLRSSSSVRTAVFLTLHDLREALSDDALKTVLQALQQRYIELTRNNVGAPPLSPPSPITGLREGSVMAWPNGASSQMPRIDSEDDSLRFLIDTIAALPGGAEVAERALMYLPKSTANRLRQERGPSE